MIGTWPFIRSVLCTLTVCGLVAACAPSEEEVQEVSEAVAAHVKTINFQQLGSYAFDRLVYSDQRNSTAPRKHWIVIRLIQNDGARRASDPRDMPRRLALKHPENVLSQSYCPPKSLTDEYSAFGVYLSIYSTRFDERYRVLCPL